MYLEVWLTCIHPFLYALNFIMELINVVLVYISSISFIFFLVSSPGYTCYLYFKKEINRVGNWTGA